MTQDQFNQIVEAILEGKYSWACVLILQFAGYNPLHYIPYRTYNRITKENYKAVHRNRSSTPPSNSEQQTSEIKPYHSVTQRLSSQINDLTYLEVVSKSPHQIQGGKCGHAGQWFQIDDLNDLAVVIQSPNPSQEDNRSRVRQWLDSQVRSQPSLDDDLNWLF
jgi:hypothetical protein